MRHQLKIFVKQILEEKGGGDIFVDLGGGTFLRINLIGFELCG